MTLGRRARTAGIVIAFIAGAGAPRAARIDHMLVDGDRLDVTLAAGDRRTVSVAVLDGSKLSVTVARGKRSSVEPWLGLTDISGREVDAGKHARSSKKAARVRNLPVSQTGIWRAAFAALSGGGPARVTVKAKSPRTRKLSGDLADSEQTAAHELNLLPGSTISLKIKSKGKPAWTPTATLETPSGQTVLFRAPGKTPLTTAVTDEMGTHVLRIGGGPGAYRAKVKITPPDVKGRPLQYRDVEALPSIDSFTPATLRNDDTTEIILSGFGFAYGQSVTLTTETTGVASAPITGFSDDAAAATLDLTGVAPGFYRVGVSTSAGNTTHATQPIEVTNRPPTLVSVEAPEFPQDALAEMRIHGRGFDPDCEVYATRSSDDLEMPVVIYGQVGHTAIDTLFVPPRYGVGTYDLTIVDLAGESRETKAAIDVLGYREEPTDVAQESLLLGSLHPRDAAYDADSGTILLSYFGPLQSSTFVLLDATTLETLQTFTATTTYADDARVEWSRQDDTFAMCWVERSLSGVEHGWVRICDADDLDDELSLTRVISDYEVSQVDAAADADNGGYLAVWESYDGSDSYTAAQPFASDGTPDPDGASVVFESTTGISWSPTIVYRGDGHFVVAHIGTTPSVSAFALRRIVLAPDARVVAESKLIAASTEWFYLLQPEMAVNPTDGSVLVGFSYLLEDRFRPAFARLEGLYANPEEVRATDGDGLAPEGLLDSIVWNPERGEFVAGLTRAFGLVTSIRRVDPDGRLRTAFYEEIYEGIWAVLWSGPRAGQMGFARSCDGVDDWTIHQTDATIRAGHIR